MDVRAIVLTGCPGEPKDHSGCFIDSEKFAGVPLVLLPVLGQPVRHRIIDHLQSVGIDSCSVLNAADRALPAFEDAGRADIKWQNVSSNQLWRAAEEEFDEMARGGAELVLLLRLGAYAEVELDPLLQFHLDQRNHTTQVVAADGPLDFFVLSGSRRN